MLHTFRYSLKTLFRNRMLLFWTFAFPIILGTLFHMAFSNISESEKLAVFPIAVVENDSWQENEFFREAFSALGKEGEDQLFDLRYADRAEAEAWLQNGEVEGVLELDGEEVFLTFASDGIDQTILKFTADEVAQKKKIVEALSQEEIEAQLAAGNFAIDADQIREKVEARFNESESPLHTAESELDYVMIEYYTLIAMTCLYGGILAMTALNQNLANLSDKGKRVTVSPASKGKTVLASVAASFAAQLLGLAILFLFTIFVLKVDYGSRPGLVVLLAVVGSLAGLALGIAVGGLVKASENSKTGILIAITMFGSFLSGMMGITMKYVVDKNAPWINKLNPAAMITDGFYALYAYHSLSRFWWNVGSLILFSVILITISACVLRRQRYDSI